MSQDDDDVYADWSALRTALPVAVGLLLVGITGLVAFRTLAGTDDEPVGQGTTIPGAESTTTAVVDVEAQAAAMVARFLEALTGDGLATLEYAFSEPQEAVAELASVTGGLGEFRLVSQAGPIDLDDPPYAAATVRHTWALADGTEFQTEGVVDLVRFGTEWRIDWSAASLESSLGPGDVFVRERVVAPRAPILDRNGFGLVDNRAVTEVGVIPRQAGEIEPLSQNLGRILGEDPEAIRALIAPSPSDATVVVATRRADALAPLEAQLLAVPGVVLQPITWPLTPDERFGRALFGRSGEVTAEILDEHPDLFQVGDIVGRSGLQRQYNARLSGLPGAQIRIERRFPSTGSRPSDDSGADTEGTATTAAGAGGAGGTDGAATDPGDAAAPGDATTTTDPASPVTIDPDDPVNDPDVVFLEPPVPGTPLQLTIDAGIQRAAEDALAGTGLTSSLVAVQPSTGHVLAAANGPGAAVQNFALTGRYPPGSIFKIVTAYAALSQGVAASDPVDCPATLEVNGRVFRNAEGEVLGTVPMRRAFVLSCNTAFINIGATLDPSAYPANATRFGLGAGYDLGVAADSGSIPTPEGPVDRAATSFGQGRVLVSPLSAAVMASTAAAGTYREPRLVLEPGEIGPDGSVAPVPGQALDPGPADQLRQFMRAVVTNGTGRAASGAAGGPVSGKTGTAEFGNEVPPQAHAWFVGFQGDLAFAVFVEAGEFGGATAAPIATDFLNRVAAGG